MLIVVHSSVSLTGRMAEVSKMVGREAGRFVALSRDCGQTFSRIDGKLSVGAILGSTVLYGARQEYTASRLTAQLEGKELLDDCSKRQLGHSGCATCQHLRGGINCTGHQRWTVPRSAKCSCLPKAESHRKCSYASDLDVSLEVRDKNNAECIHNINNMSGHQVGAVACKLDLFGWFGSDRDELMTERPEAQGPGCRLLLSNICSLKGGQGIAFPKKTFLVSDPHLPNYQPQRGLCALLNLPGMQWSYFMQGGCSRAFVRDYSWHSRNSSAATPPLYRSRTAYYDILQVSPNATQAQIKTAYYRQSFMYHPDRNSGSEEATQRFSEISEAYTVLGSIALRRKYDRGILSQTDVQGAGKPSAREARSSSPTGQQQKKHRHTHTNVMGDKKIFDFDAFYQAHYGEQLQRERELRLRRKKLREEMQRRGEKEKMHRMTELTVLIIVVFACCFIAAM